MKKIVVVLSGGLDSTVLLHHYYTEGDIVRAISIDYGQRHSRELQFARQQAKALDIPHEVADLSSLSRILPGSSQTDLNVPVPEGHYTAENMKATVVANRNMILLSVAIGHAIAHGFDYVAYAAHAGDHAIYPDCRPEFAEAVDKVAQLCDWKPVHLLRPFVHMSKSEIVRIGHAMGVPLADTWSCYMGQEKHCGRCGTCVERAEAFRLAGVPDPTVYQDETFFQKMTQK